MRITKDLFKGIIDAISDMVMIIDPKDYGIITVNKQYLEKEGLLLKDIKGKKCYEITHKRASYCENCPMLETMKTGSLARAEHLHYDKDKKMYYSEIITYPIFDRNGKIKVITNISRDITERKKLDEENRHQMEKLRELSVRDPHTGLYNYRYMMERLSSELELAKRHSLNLSVMLMDIDYFKSINDVYGHQTGNQILSELADFIKAALRASDILTRYGGEEFVAIMPQTEKRNALYIANRIIEKLNNHIFKIDKLSIKIKLSIGVSDFSSDNGLISPKEILDAADSALQRAKEPGGNRAVLFSPLYRNVKRKSTKIDHGKQVEVLKRKIVKLGQRVDQTVLESMYAFSKSLEVRDYYTAEHAERMIAIVLSIGKKMGFTKNMLENLERAAVLHDIGKIGIADTILRKKGKLTPEEYKIIKNHPQIGAEIIRAVHFLKDVVPIVLHHHERFDGQGYPSGLKNGEIPLSARIVAIADAYQALMSDRPYRKAYSKKEALNILKKEAGTHFDKEIVATLINIERSE